MAKRKFKRAKAIFEEVRFKKEEKLFETEYWKKITNKIKKGLRFFKKNKWME